MQPGPHTFSPCTRFPHFSRSLAFTLIELLIVVAIIAILAAIAVPNFLEAQIRAKAARGRADLTSINTALECYRVDNPRYPTMIQTGFMGGGVAGSELLWWYTPDALSTPVAYLTSADAHCPFGGDINQSANFPGQIWRRYSYENVKDLVLKQQTFPILTAKYGPNANALDVIGDWRILCIGPDQSWNPMVQYDPTNGTTSAGNLMRTQKSSSGYPFY